MTKLKPCPCGKTPKKIVGVEIIYDDVAFAGPDCCYGWVIELKIKGLSYGAELQKLAEDVWNELPRGGLK